MRETQRHRERERERESERKREEQEQEEKKKKTEGHTHTHTHTYMHARIHAPPLPSTHTHTHAHTLSIIFGRVEIPGYTASYADASPARHRGGRVSSVSCSSVSYHTAGPDLRGAQPPLFSSR